MTQAVWTQPTHLEEAQPTGWSIRRYLWLLLGLAIASGPFLLLAKMVGMPLLGVAPLALVVLGLTVAKPEAGLLMMLMLFPMEDAMSVIPRTLTVIRLLGVYVLGVYAVHAVTGKRLVLNEPYVRRHAILVLVMWVSILLSRYPLEGMTAMQTPLAFVAFTVLALSLIHDWRMVDNAFVFMFIGAVAGATLGLVLEYTAGQSLSSERISTGTGRLGVGEMSNPNSFGRAIGLGLLLLPYLWWRFHGLLAKTLICAGALLIAVAVVKSGARAVWVSLMLTLPAAFWFAETRLTARTAKTVAIVVVAVVALVVALHMGLVSSRIMERFSMLNQGVQAGGRSTIWRVCIAAFMDHPILGMGHTVFGATSVEVAVRHSLSLPHNVSRDPHSTYLAVLADMGIMGALSYGAILVYMARSLWRFPGSALRGTMIGVFLFLLIVGITGTSLHNKSFWMPFAIMAAAVAVHRRQQAQQAFEPMGSEGPHG